VPSLIVKPSTFIVEPLQETGISQFPTEGRQTNQP